MNIRCHMVHYLADRFANGNPGLDSRANRGYSFYRVNTIFLTVLVFPACNERIYIPGRNCSGFHCIEWSPLILIPSTNVA